jgi:hypothetical protein
MRRFVQRLITRFIFGLVTLLLAVAAQAQVGVRAGVSADPDQFFFGAHAETKPLVGQLTFRPNAEIGVGDDCALVALNLEFAWWIPVPRQRFSVYLGAGPAANIYSDRGNGGGGGGASGGLNFLVGVQHKEGLFAELKVGSIDSPSVRFTVGYVFQ